MIKVMDVSLSANSATATFVCKIPLLARRTRPLGQARARR